MFQPPSCPGSDQIRDRLHRGDSGPFRACPHFSTERPSCVFTPRMPFSIFAECKRRILVAGSRSIPHPPTLHPPAGRSFLAAHTIARRSFPDSLVALSTFGLPSSDDTIEVVTINTATARRQTDDGQRPLANETIDGIDGAIERLSDGRQLDQATSWMCGVLLVSGHECEFAFTGCHRDTA